MLRNMPELEESLRDLLMRMMSAEVSVTTVVLTFISNLIMYALFAMIGGILMVAGRPAGEPGAPSLAEETNRSLRIRRAREPRLSSFRAIQRSAPPS